MAFFWPVPGRTNGIGTLDELGTLLREAREARGVTLADAQEATKINSRYLEALEDGRYDALPSEVHVKGYLRNYARYLRLDPKPLLDRYELNRNNRRTAAAPEPEPDEDLSALGPLDAPEEQVFFDLPSRSIQTPWLKRFDISSVL